MFSNLAMGGTDMMRDEIVQPVRPLADPDKGHNCSAAGLMQLEQCIKLKNVPSSKAADTAVRYLHQCCYGAHTRADDKQKPNPSPHQHCKVLYKYQPASAA